MKRYEPTLDGLRGVAVLSVMGYHSIWSMRGGFIGVDVFFVLSGYLITGILLREAEATGSVDYFGFLARRVRRLLPALALLLLVYLAAAPFLLSSALAHRAWFDVTVAGLYLTDIREGFWSYPTPLNHTWSLSIEEQFYLLWPFALLWLSRLPRRRAVALLCVAWAAITVARSVYQMIHGGGFWYYFPPFRASGLLLGAALALRPISCRAAGLALVPLLAAPFLLQVESVASIPLAELLTAGVIIGRPAVLRFAPLRDLGKISYGVYLWHVPILFVIGDNMPAKVVAAWAASFLVAALSYTLIERRFRVHAGHPDVMSTASSAA